jgi:GNAT superfamily N-acetyltransferase
MTRAKRADDHLMTRPPGAPAPPTTPAESSDGALPFTINPPLPHVREYRDEDAEAVARMWRESASAWPGGGPGGGEHATAPGVRQEQRDLNTLATYVAFLPDPESGDERAVGYCTLMEYTGEANTAYVALLSAHPAWHGKGVGRDLLRAALERTVALGYTRLDLNTWAGNLKAVPLYKKSGYFWVPDTTVKMENYLPLIFRLPAAQDFFRTADWYRDFKRDLTVRQDDEKRGVAEVFTYEWEHDGRRLRVVIDRRARGVSLLETAEYVASVEIDDPRLPIGGRRTARWRVENTSGKPVQVSVLAEGEDAVRCAFTASGVVEADAEWSAPVTAEQPKATPPSNRPSNRVRTTMVVDGRPVQLVAGTRPVQPVGITLDWRKRWLPPGVARTMHVALENELDAPVSGTLRLSATPGASVDRTEIAFDLEARSRATFPLTVQVDQAGTETVRASASVNVGDAVLTTAVVTQELLCGELGAVFVEQQEEQVVISTDRVVLRAPLKPTGDWMVRFRVSDRESDQGLLTHATSLGPPFVPSVFTNSTWRPRIEQRSGALLLALSTTPESMPGLTFERQILLSASGLIRVTYSATNTGSGPRTLEVNSGTNVGLDPARGGTFAAVPLATGLVVEESDRFPDWREGEVGNPDRYAESWMAEFGDGWVGATVWTQAKEVLADWSTPDLTLDLGTIQPGQSVQTAPVYVYGGQGDWKTARALWHQLAAPDADRERITPARAHRARLERFAFDTPGESAESAVLLESDRTRGLNGSVWIEAGGAELARGEVKDLKLGTPASVAVSLPLPAEAAAVPATIVLDHERTTERYETAVIRVGAAGSTDGDGGGDSAAVRVSASGSAGTERVTIENGRLRIGVIPDQVARVAELSIRGPDGEWQNQLHSPPDEPGVWVWFNPWYGGIHPALALGRNYPGSLAKERFAWRETERTGSQGVRWHGISARTTVTGAASSGVRHGLGLRVEVSYLTAGLSNVLAVALNVTNDGPANVDGALWMHSFLQPAGDRTTGTLHYDVGVFRSLGCSVRSRRLSGSRNRPRLYEAAGGGPTRHGPGRRSPGSPAAGAPGSG